jgi:hypothetical protein
VGRRPATAAKLAALGVTTAAGLRDLPPRQARAVGTVTLERTVLELNGLCCLALEEVAPQRKGMAVTRSFGRAVTSWTSCARQWRPTPRAPARSCGRTAWSPGGSPPSSTPARTATGRSTTASARRAWCR